MIVMIPMNMMIIMIVMIIRSMLVGSYGLMGPLGFQ